LIPPLDRSSGPFNQQEEEQQPHEDPTQQQQQQQQQQDPEKTAVGSVGKALHHCMPEEDPASAFECNICLEVQHLPPNMHLHASVFLLRGLAWA